MRVLVVNCGSSSIKLNLIETASGERMFSASVERLNHPDCRLRISGEKRDRPKCDHAAALAELFRACEHLTVDAVGHRVVHGGSLFTQPTLIAPSILPDLASVSPLAPLHNPSNLIGIEHALATFPDVPQVAVFDTAFHRSLPRRVRQYALPNDLVDKHGLRRYGFHGTSHEWVSQQAANWLSAPVDSLRLISCHLGNGASICAVEYGRSVETSMGMTPLEGLVMGTRSGDVDPGVLIELMRKEGLTPDELDVLLNKKSGLAGLSGVGGDLRDILSAAAKGNESCRMALQVFSHRLRKYIGAYAAIMGGVDALIFTAGIGENSAEIRHRVAQRLEFLGARLDEVRNRDAHVSQDTPVFDISDPASRVKILVVATDESRAIAESAANLINQDAVAVDLTIPIAVSARHIHLTDDAVECLFGPGHTLTPYKPLSQPGQFACEEKLTVVGPRDRIEGVRVLGPTRPKCQIEVSRTDEFKLGIDAPVRNSGDVDNSPGITLIGPFGTLNLQQGLICARRHIHMTPADAERFGVKDKDVVEVAVNSDGRDLVFGDVLIRVKSTYALEMHIDTDEANAAEVIRGQTGTLAKTSAQAIIRRVNSNLSSAH